MILKDAFRFQNKLKSLLMEASAILKDHRNVMKVETTYLRKKVMPESEDEVLLTEPPSEYADHINDIISFLMFLLDERCKLSQAIHEAKAKLSIDMDHEVSLNRQRQELANTFRGMIALRSSEKIISGGGEGYRFNAEGNQVAYRCDIKRVSTINFNRNTVRKLAVQLDQKSNETSTEIDRCLVNTEIDYEPALDMNASFDEILQDYIEKQSAKFRYDL